MPVLAPFGSILIVYVPVVGNVCCERLKVPPQLKVDVKLVPSGFSSVTVKHENVLFAILTVASWPEVPLNVMFAFWPGFVMVTGRADPLIVTEPLTSVTL